MRRLIYIGGTSYPSKRANFLQVISQIKGFSINGIQTILFLPYGFSKIKWNKKEEIRRNYHIPKEIQIILVPFMAKSIFYNLAVLACSLWMKKDVIVTRVYDVFRMGRMLKMDIFYECHDPKNLKYGYSTKGIYTISRELSDMIQQDNEVPYFSDATDLNFAEIDQRLMRTSAPSFFYAGKIHNERGIELLNNSSLLKRYSVRVAGSLECDLNEKIEFLGFLSREEIKKHINNSEVLLLLYSSSLPTLNFASPLKLYDYMASGRMIIAPDIPIISNYTECYENIELYSIDDQNSFEDAIGRCLLKLKRGVKISPLNRTWEQRSREIIAYIEETR